MDCSGCGSAAVSERSERTAQGYRRFRCRASGKQFNERSAGSLNRTQYLSDIIALVVLWRLCYKLALRDLPEMFLIRGIVFSHEAVHDWKSNSHRHWLKASGDPQMNGGGPHRLPGGQLLRRTTDGHDRGEMRGYRGVLHDCSTTCASRPF